MPKELRNYLLVLTACVAICFLTECFCGLVLRLGFPYNWPLLFRHPSFVDFDYFVHHFQTLHTEAFFHGPEVILYPTSIVVWYWAFYLFQPHEVAVFLSFIAVSTVFAAVLLQRVLVRRGLSPSNAALLMAVTYAFAYGLWFDVKQGNIEIVVWALLSMALYAWSKRYHWAAATLIGVAGAMKFFPLVFLGLLFSRKRYWECVWCLCVAVLFTVGSLWFVGPSISYAWHGTQQNLKIHHDGYMLFIRVNESGFDHSLWMVARKLMPHSLSAQLRSQLLSLYLATAAISGVALYFFRIRHLPAVNQLLCLTLASTLLPPNSFDYTLVHLYAPWALLCFVAVKAQRQGRQVEGLGPVLVLMAVAMAPLSEFIFRGDRIGSALRCCVMTAAFVLALRRPFPLAEFDEPVDAPPSKALAA